MAAEVEGGVRAGGRGEAVTDFLHTVAVPWLQAFLMAFVPIAGSIAGAAIIAELRRRNLDTAWFQAISRAGGVGYAALLASGKPITDKAALLAAAQAGAGYLQDRVLPQLQARALSPDAAAQIAGAEMGKLLASDPTVGPIAPLPAPAVLQNMAGKARG